jgi:hypothetical protein
LQAGRRGNVTSISGILWVGETKNVASLEIHQNRSCDLLEGFVNGTCGDGEWDAFISVRQKNPELEKIRLWGEQLGLEFDGKASGLETHDDDFKDQRNSPFFAAGNSHFAERGYVRRASTRSV